MIALANGTATPVGRLASSACCLLLGLAAATEATAQAYPARSIRLIVAFAPGSIGTHGGRWAVYRATWIAGDSSELVTSWSELQAQIAAGNILLVRDAAADFRCPVLGDPSPIS